MNKSKNVSAFIMCLGMMLFSNLALPDSPSKTTKPIDNSENNSLTAPTSDYPYDKKERQDANDRNLSSRPPHNPDTNNKPFDGSDQNKSSGQVKPY